MNKRLKKKHERTIRISDTACAFARFYEVSKRFNELFATDIKVYLQPRRARRIWRSKYGTVTKGD